MSNIQAVNPRTGDVDFSCESQDAAAVAKIADRLKLGQTAWANDLQHRLSTMDDWAAALQAHAVELGDALLADTGRRMLSHFEVAGMVARIKYWHEHAPRLLEPAEEKRSVTADNVGYLHQRVPYGLVGVISPWNFPLTLALVDAIPALFAGCAVLIKPSEVTPRFAVVLKKSIEAVPALAAVLGVVIGDGETGVAVVDNADMLCFTGSVATGKKVALRAAENFIPACLELGGKDPAIVLADADVDAAADAILRSAAGSCGQACMSLERIYAQRRVFEPLIDALVSKSQDLSYNTPDIHKGALYPFIDQRQAHKVAEQLKNALDQGAVLHCGGAPELIAGGYWMRPTVLSEIHHDMQLMQEETFGPLLPIMDFDTDEEAVSLANDSDFGLSGSVFGIEEHAISLAKNLHVGAVGINDASMTALIFDIEKQSFGFSGLGPSRMGDEGLLRFLRTKALMLQRDRPVPIQFLDEAGLPG